MKKILIATIALGIIAGPAVAGSFPEKAESRVLTTSKSYGGDVAANLMQKKWDQIHPTTHAAMFDTSYALFAGSSSVVPIFSPNR